MSEAHDELTLTRYRAMWADAPRPSDGQIDAFARFVCHAHSWYKHLPLFPPGAPFTFFLDPAAGRDLVRAEDGTFALRDRVGDRGFHYTWMPTACYRERFGSLGYHCDRGTSFQVGGMVSRVPGAAPTIIIDGRPTPLPQAICEVARIELTGLIHRRSASVLLWKGTRWPPGVRGPWERIEDGAAIKATVEAAIAAWDQDRAEGRPYEDGKVAPDGVALEADESLAIYRALEPERERQRASMVAAIRRMLSLVQP